PRPGRVQHQFELLADPALAAELGQRAWPQRRLERALLGLGVRRHQVPHHVVAVVVLAHALDNVRNAARSSTGTDCSSPASGSAAATPPAAPLTDQPSPTRPACTWPRHSSRTATCARPAGVLLGAPIRSLSSSTIRCAPF